ncbi:thiol-disulfide oxidoreductase ResA [Fictibacillus aquaticus]|uniref:Thiol-disulfide oxidoreductase n=1 Tax=Fictibacillus aquaticus TaxID=2021314 RepID=A0A235FC99_9BACL|nr:thiol-disulfide oxidoreductase ResA [Fictibacillus aquaticus]OYD58415.1 thiol-disulfide oxidoreductase [Fictibacillus aquaticus]
MKRNGRFWFRSILLALIAAAIGYTVYSSFFIKERTLVNSGDQAPDFVLTDVNGKEVRLSDYRGKGVFLNFWGTWCKPCEREMPYMERQFKVYKEQGVEILAVNVGESNIAVEDFRDKYRLTFSIPLDKNRDVTRAYGIGPIPTTLTIDKNGKVVEKTSRSLSNKDIVQMMEKIKP